MNILRLSTLSLTVAIAVFALGYVNPSFAGKPVKECPGHPSCKDDGGDTGSAADPAFAYVKPANGSNKIALANADGSAVTEIFVGTRFSFAMEPAVIGDASGGQVLIGDFSNLHHITYSVNNGVITVDSDIKIHDRDIGPSTHRASPDWSPNGADFAFRNSSGFIYIDSRATYNSNGVVTDFGAPVYDEDRAGSRGRVESIAWDAPDVIHFIADDPGGGGVELRSLDITECNPTCDSATTTCIASTGSPSCAGAEVLGTSNLRHVSVNHNASCSGSVPRILVSGNDDGGNPVTFVLDGSMPTLTILNFEGHDWTPNCTIVGSPGDDTGGPIQGGAIVDVDPYSSRTTTLIRRKGQSPDWIN